MNRRRFLAIISASVACAGAARAQEWRGRAFGADVSISVDGAAPLEAILAEIAAIEQVFSLFGPSELAALNRTGSGRPSPRLREVLEISGRVHRATGGCFDPTVQPVWRALAAGGDAAAARRAVGFGRVDLGDEVRLAEGQALTLNGIVQGYAADRVIAILARHGLRDCLVDMGEYAALGGPFRLGVEDPSAGLIGMRSLAGGRALATSSPAALILPGGSHILGPHGERPQWSSVCVEAGSAALADAASTAFVLMGAHAIRAARETLGLGPVVLVDFAGDAETI